MVALNEYEGLYTIGCLEEILQGKFTVVGLSVIDQVFIIKI